MQFYELAVGARFTFFGRRYKKVAPRMAEDERLHGHIVAPDAEVVLEGEPLLLTAEEAAEWKPEEDWAAHITPAPGQ